MTTAELFSVLSHSTRIEILVAVSAANPQPVSVGYLSIALKKPMHHVSRHLSELERAGFVSKSSIGQWIAVRIKRQRINELLDFLERIVK